MTSVCIISHGIDIVAIAQIETLVKRVRKEFEQQHFTGAELCCAEASASCIQYFASRLAAKKAVLGAMGCQHHPHPLWLDIEIQRLSTGQPSVVLYPQCQAIASERGITRWLLSMSHTVRYATASAVALYNQP